MSDFAEQSVQKDNEDTERKVEWIGKAIIRLTIFTFVVLIIAPVFPFLLFVAIGSGSIIIFLFGNIAMLHFRHELITMSKFFFQSEVYFVPPKRCKKSY